MWGAPSAACGARVGIGSSGTSSWGLIGCTTSMVEQDYTVRRQHMKDMVALWLRYHLRCPQRRPCSHHQCHCSTSTTRCHHRHRHRPCNRSSRLFPWQAAPPQHATHPVDSRVASPTRLLF
ncbi:Os01g0563350 [Oryza sativa Japonica Group]|uniref:Os01g0563350 protein n=1 Tax=Oryza sativa subsp. japonica TaxID=39947 RepID=A0A0P0V4C1_ORYSJ|nr:Os01g0563350 [Oryza sativa Japonica Group]